MKRVLFNAKRDANPFFHVMESLWMLSGRRDVGFVEYYAANMKNYSDDGKILHGAYGHRWIYHFAFNQLTFIAEELKRDPNSRRCVLAMWDSRIDWPACMQNGKDVPCNTHAYFAVRNGKLNITVMNRSNDLVWGALGANAVHFSFLLEWMAWRVGIPMGVYHQFTNNLHIYEPHWHFLDDVESTMGEVAYPAPTYPLAVRTIPHRLFDIELDRFMFQEEHSLDDYYTVPFLNNVARPIAAAWQTRKTKKGTGLVELADASPCDWVTACKEWIERRELAKETA